MSGQPARTRPPARRRCKPRRGQARLQDLLPLCGLGLVLLLALSWLDVLPGGWRLRGWIEPHALRQAREVDARIAARLAQFAAENPAVPPGAILFLGSSTVERFPLERAFPAKPCLNRGIGGLTALRLAGILRDCLPPGRPAGVVLATGGIDWRAGGRDEALLERRVEGVLSELSRALPGVPVALIGVLPERAPPDTAAAPVDRAEALAARAAGLRRANDRLAALAKEHGIAFVDAARPPIRDSSGALDPAFSVDDLHLNEAGYRHLAGCIVEQGGAVGRLLAP